MTLETIPTLTCEMLVAVLEKGCPSLFVVLLKGGNTRVFKTEVTS